MPKLRKKTTSDIRAILFQELDLLRSGKIAPSRANATVQLVGKTLASVKMDMDRKRLAIALGEKAKSNVIDVKLTPVELDDEVND